MCNHDATYKAENEANGGTGCPLCNREYRERHMPTLGKRVVMVQHASGAIETANDFAELSDDEIATLEAMTSETASEAPEYDGMWK